MEAQLAVLLLMGGRGRSIVGKVRADEARAIDQDEGGGRGQHTHNGGAHTTTGGGEEEGPSEKKQCGEAVGGG